MNSKWYTEHIQSFRSGEIIMTIAETAKKYDISAIHCAITSASVLFRRVPRTRSGIRDYDESSCGWVEFIKCMRGAGLQIEALIEYVSLFRQGDETSNARRAILIEQRGSLPSASRRCSRPSSVSTERRALRKMCSLRTYHSRRRGAPEIKDSPPP